MSTSRFQYSALPARHRFTSAVALLAYVVSAIGFPLPLAETHDSLQPSFPCQGHHCGCKSADQCWRSCCCFTLAERQAWATKHGVKIPADVCAAHEEHAGPRGCCAAHDHAAEHRATEPAARNAPGKLNWVYGFQAQKCQGLTMLWVATGVTLPQALPVFWEYQWVEIGQLHIHSDSYLSPSSQPPVPPPLA